MAIKKRLIVLAALVVLVDGGVFYTLRPPPVPAIVVRVSGNIEVTEAQASFRVPVTQPNLPPSGWKTGPGPRSSGASSGRDTEH